MMIRTSFMGGIAAKMSAMLLVMAALIVAALAVSLLIFGDVSTSLDAYEEELVPRLRRSSTLVEYANDLGEGLSGLLIAGTAEDLGAEADQIRTGIDRLRAESGAMQPEVAAAVAAEIAVIEESVARIETARTDEIGYDIVTLESSDALGAAVESATSRLAMMSGDALASVLADGEATIDQEREALGYVGAATALERTIKRFESVVLSGASADDAAGVEAASAEAAALGREITALAGAIRLDRELSGLIPRILAQAEPESGILAARSRVIAARGTANEASHTAATSVSAIAGAARGPGRKAVDEIASGSLALQAEADRGQSVMWAIGAVALLVLVLTPLVARRSVVRPLVAVTRETERLASGDTAPVVGFERQGGEIGRMAAALKVFRDNMIERTRLEAEEHEREIVTQRREAEARERAAEEARLREEAERQRERAAEEAEHARQAKEAEAREEMRQREEAQRAAHAAEQELVVKELDKGLKSLAEGDLEVRIETRFPEAYEALRQNFNETVGSLAQVIAQIAESADRIESNAGEIASASNDLSHRTEQQAAALEETAAAVEELTASVRAAAQNAEKVDQDVTTTRRSAEDSGRVVHDAVEAMGEIERSSEQITRIVGVIDNIAFQTNLLALNAGVEAARAGDAGRGFAVVASEVRALAQRSSEAAREINELISTSSGQVERGVDLVRRTGVSLESIVASVANVASLVSGIASSAREQSISLAEVNTSVGQLDQVTQQNAAMVEESTAASNEMRNEARSLAGLFARFRTGAGGTRAALPERGRVAAAPKAALAKPAARAAAPAPARKQGSAALAAKPFAVAQDDWSEF
jgi:methyl-accepting chemotaxis protein